MKKATILALLALCSASASAQIWVGGQLGFSYTGTEDANEHYEMSTSSQAYTVSPKVGYDINEHFAIGLNLGFSYISVNSTYYYIKRDEHSENNYSVKRISVFPFVRYSFAEWQKVRFFVDGGVGYRFDNDESSSYSPIKNFYIAFNPGITYPINDKVGLVAHLGELSYGRTTTENSDPYNQFTFNLESNLQFGFYLKL